MNNKGNENQLSYKQHAIIINQPVLPDDVYVERIGRSGTIRAVYSDKWKTRQPMNGEWKHGFFHCSECPDGCEAVICLCFFDQSIVYGISIYIDSEQNFN